MTASFRTKGLWTSLTLLSVCAACCAFPLLGALGIGAASSATFAAFVTSDFQFLLIAGVLATLTALLIAYIRSHARGKCKSVCAMDRSCCGQEEQQS
jgi:hypothetical protein